MSEEQRFGIGSRSLGALRKSKCDRLRSMVVSRHEMAAVAQQFGVSVPAVGAAALAYGVRFERSLYRTRDGQVAYGLVDALARAALIPLREAAVVALDAEADDAVAQTTARVLMRQASDPTTIVLGAKLVVPGFESRVAVYPDALVAVVGSAEWAPLEIKAYESRSHLTSGDKVSAAAAQAALYALCLEAVLGSAPESGILVFRRVGSMYGEAFAVDLRRDLAGHRATIGDLAGRAATPVEALKATSHTYGDACAIACLLDAACRDMRLSSGDPVAYGTSLAAFTGGRKLSEAFAIVEKSALPDELAEVTQMRYAFNAADALIAEAQR